MAEFVLLHGGGQGSWVWAETIAALDLQATGAGHRCMALDVPGCGLKRGRDTADIGFDAIVDELVADVEAAGLRDVTLVGHSQAGTLLPGLVERRPELFLRLVYVTCTAPDAGLDLIEMHGTRVHGRGETEGGRAFNDPSMDPAERNRLMFCNDMPLEQAELFLDKLGQDNWPRSSYRHRDWRYRHLVDVPSAYVLCLRDGIIPPDWQEYYAKQLRCWKTVRIDAGHQVMNTRPHALAEVLLLEAAT